ncbi:MAG TPA: beta-phosphoglucomutase, partial [Bacteroidales bacterium]|nr:beta-phosphoglucomutase [Bacteroidales bacterium]
ACIFDLDGVIVDTAKYHYIAWKEIARELDFDFTEHDNERLKGVSRMRSLDILLEIGNRSFDLKAKEALADKKNNIYVGYIQKMTRDEILPGVLSFLEELKAAGIPAAIGSASKNTPLILERIGLAGYFKEVIDGNKTSTAKPDPEVFLLAAKGLNVSPSECVVFEDAEAGIEAALAGGMRVVGVGNPAILAKANMVIPGFTGMNLTRLLSI